MKIYIHNKFDLVVTHFLLLPLQIMTFLSFITLYPPSTLAYPNLNRMLDSLLSAPVSSTSSTFSLPISTVLSFTSVTSISYSSLSALPPISSMLTSLPSVLHTLLLRLIHFCLNIPLLFRHICNIFRRSAK